MTIVCERCGTGAFNNVNTNTNLKKVTLHLDGFRARNVYVHANEGVCRVVLMTKQDNARKQAEWERQQNVWWRRALRRVWPR